LETLLQRSIPLILLIAILAGCPPDDGSVPTFPGLDVTPPSAAGPAASGDPSESAGGPESVGAEDGTPAGTPAALAKMRMAGSETFKVCLILPGSGPSRDVGNEMRRGIAIAIAEIERDKDRVRTIQWVERDTKSTESGAVAAYHSCFNEGISVIIGPVHPAATTALVPVAAAHDAILLIPEIGAALPSEWSDNLFSIAPPATDMARIAAENLAGERKLKRAAVLHIDSVFGSSLRDAFVEQFKENGGTVVATHELKMTSPDTWAAAAVASAAAGARALFVVGPAEPAEAIAHAMTGSEMRDVHTMFIDWAMHPPVLRAGGNAVPRMHWVNRPLPQGAFNLAYVKSHQAHPEFPAGTGYDAAMLAARAIEAADSLWFEDIAAKMMNDRGIPSAFGTGAMVMKRDIRFEEVAGYRVVEPQQDSISERWIFGGY
jgi:ABC-type branched-subunit amino acid transport system substrate-binding protein